VSLSFLIGAHTHEGETSFIVSTADKRWSACMGVGRGSNNPWP